MEHAKQLSVVIPMFNRADVVERTLDSITAQTCKDFSLIIVDNGSTDQSVEVVKKWIDRNASEIDTRIVSEPRRGAAAARNRGLREVATPYVIFFDSDDEMRPGHIERFFSTLRAHPEADIIRWPVSLIDSDGWSKTIDHHFHDELQLHLMHGTLSTQRYAVRTDFLRNCGGWDEQLSTWDDLELGIRLLLNSPNIIKINGEPTVAIHPTDDSISGNSYSDRSTESEQALDVIQGWLEKGEHTDELFLLDCRRAILAAHYGREKNREASCRLLSKAKLNKTFRQRLILNTIYRTIRCIGRGGCAIALFLGGKKRDRR